MSENKKPNSSFSKVWNSFRDLVGLDKQVPTSGKKSGPVKVEAPGGMNLLSAAGVPILDPKLTQNVQASTFGFKVIVKAHQEAPSTLGALIVAALDIKRDRGGHTVADYPIDQLITDAPILTVEIVDTKAEQAKQTVDVPKPRINEFAADNEVQGTLTTLSRLFGIQLNNLVPGQSHDLVIYDLCSAPGASALNTLSDALPSLEVEPDAAFILLFGEAINRRTDMGMLAMYLTKLQMEAATGGAKNE